MINLKVKKLNELATIPAYQTVGAACFDISTTSESQVIEPGNQAKLATGLSFEIPQEHVMLVFSRSGHGFKNRVRLSNCVGVIDSDYRGELQVALENDGTEPMNINTGDRIAQAMVIRAEQVEFQIVDNLEETDRGAGGFGSTGK